MSLYNSIMGYGPALGPSLAALGAELAKIPRLRDCILKDGKIAILTRTGGNNREDYKKGNDYMRSLPGFITDEDDEFDHTFAWFWYAFPKEETELWHAAEALLKRRDIERGPRAMVEFAKKAMSDGANTHDPNISRARAAGERFAKALMDAVEKGGSGAILVGDDNIDVVRHDERH